MKIVKELFLILSLTVLFIGFSSFQNRLTSNAELKAEAIKEGGFVNLYKVNADLFRSEQPSKEGVETIKKLGIKTIINLRQTQTDRRILKNIGINAQHLRINTWTISYDDVLEALKLIRDSEKPVLIHCKHGSDRTGCVIAVYRMVYENASKEDAINEFLNKQYGYHETYFPNILRLLNAIDIEKVKKDLNKN
jgi:tyrosine-protein phosphatase SIW14